MAETNRAIFLVNETTGAITDTITQASGDSSLVSRQFSEDSEATTDRTLIVDVADDDAGGPTIQVLLSQKIGEAWTDFEEIKSAEAAPHQILLSLYDNSVWRKNNGYQLKFVKVGAYAVTYTNAYLI